MFRIIEEVKFTEKIEKLEKMLPRTAEFKRGLYITLQHIPFGWGTPVAKKPNWKYGIYFVGKSDTIGKYPAFNILYRVTDDCVYLIDMSAIKF